MMPSVNKSSDINCISDFDYSSSYLLNVSRSNLFTHNNKEMQKEDYYKIFESELFALIMSTTEINYEKFKEEKTLLEYFYFKEQACLKRVKELKYYNKEKLFQSIIFEELTRLFYKNPIGKNVKLILSEIDINKLNNKKDLLTYLCNEFKTELIPKFLIKDYIEVLKKFEFVENYDNIQYNSNKFDTVNKNKSLVYYDLIINHYENLSNFKLKPFETYTNKNIYFNIFILCNYKNFRKSSFYENILKRNFKFITCFFDIDYKTFTFQTIYDSLINISKEEHTKELQKNMNLLISEINENESSLIFIIASYYYFIKNDLIPLNLEIRYHNNPRFLNLFYSLEETFEETFRDIITFNLKILISYLDSYCLKRSRFKFNLNDQFPLNNEQLDNSNQIYSINIIDYFIMNSKKTNLIDKYIQVKQSLGQTSKDYDSKKEIEESNTPSGIINNVHENIINLLSPIETIFQKIRISPYTINTSTKSISILISGFLSEGDEAKHNRLWHKFVPDKTKFTMFYFYHWPAETKENFASFNNIKNPFTSLPLFFRKSKAISKDIGKLLGIILHSRLFFPCCSINLIAFSLGCNVIKHCIKTLYEFESFDIINNVVLMGGATTLSKTDKWEKILSSVVAGKIYNCYSHHDTVLKLLYQNFVKYNPIGLKALDLGNENLIQNMDFSNMKIGHFQYRKRFPEFVKLFDLN